MERREGLRRTAELDVVLDHQPVCLAPGRVTDLSITGAYVRTHGQRDWRPDSDIELVALVRNNGATSVHRLPATIARIGRDGVGLKFNRFDLAAFKALVALIAERRRITARLRAKVKSAATPSKNAGAAAMSGSPAHIRKDRRVPRKDASAEPGVTSPQPGESSTNEWEKVPS